MHSKIYGGLPNVRNRIDGVWDNTTNFYTRKGSAERDEKGYFEFGGSTVILKFENGRMRFSEDLLENTSNGLETLVLI